MKIRTAAEMKRNVPERFAWILDHVFEQVRAGRIKVGEELPSAGELAAALGVSESESAAALREMETLCLVEKRSGSGPYIFGSVSNGFTHTFDVMRMLGIVGPSDVGAFRKSMELAVYDLAFRNRNKRLELAEMKEVLGAFPQENIETQIRLDQRFHYLLTEMTDNGVMTMLMSAIFEIYGRWVTRGLGAMPERGMRRLHNAHTKIYESLLHNDKAAGLEAIDEHYYLIELAGEEMLNVRSPRQPLV